VEGGANSCNSNLHFSLPESEFGQIFTGFYHKGKNAIKKLLQEKEGQITGAFYNKQLGDIDLVWGKVTNAKLHKGYGLAHILDKHPDFSLDEIPKIIKKEEITKTRNGFNISYKVNGVRISNNRWIVTSFEKEKK